MIDKDTIINLPIKFTELLTESIKQSTEITVDYLKSIEKTQRDFLKKTFELYNQTLPGEGKLWEMQNNMIEKSFENYEKAYEKIFSVMK